MQDKHQGLGKQGFVWEVKPATLNQSDDSDFKYGPDLDTDMVRWIVNVIYLTREVTGWE